MNDTPTFAMPPPFLGIKRNDRDAEFCVAGIPYDLGTTNRAGARFGPSAIRQASRMLADGHHPHWRVNPTTLSLSDIGDFQIALGDISNTIRLIEQQASLIDHLLALGGDHGVTLPLLEVATKRQGTPLAVIHFDAHVDTWPENFGQHYAHGSVFYHAINAELVDPHKMIQIGIRSPVDKHIRDWTIDQGVTIIDALTVHEMGPAAIAQRVVEIIGNTPTYLSFDIDVLDPAFAPGTGTPEVGGLATWQMQGILRRLVDLRFIGMDVVEVSPPYDHAEITALAAATVAWEYLALVAAAHKRRQQKAREAADT
jgi:agmatinase